MSLFGGSWRVNKVESSSELEPSWDKVSTFFCWSILRCAFSSLFGEITEWVVWERWLSKRRQGSWKGFWKLERDFTAIQFFIWGSCWKEEGVKFDHHLTLNSIAKCVGKELLITCVWTTSQHKIHRSWKWKVNKKVWEKIVGIKPLACSLK